MNSYPLQRETILNALYVCLEPLHYTHAMWEGGAAAFGRVDQWSDIDLMVDVDDDRTGDTIQAIETVLAGLSPIELNYPLPEPTWHGHTQSFFRLKDAGPYLLVDVAVLRHSSSNKFLEPDIHGQARVWFDKSGVVRPPAADPQAMQARLRDRLASLRVTFDLYQSLTLKELHRGNWMEAIAFYQGFTLRPLVEVLRMQHLPSRHNFYTRYIYYDLPQPVVQRLEKLFFIASPQELWAKHAEAGEWFNQVVAGLQL